MNVVDNNCLINIDSVAVSLGQQTILEDISCQLKAGDILGLVGPSGCGKTTLLNAIAGFVDIQAGTIAIGQAIKISHQHNLPPEQRQVGMIFQDYALFPHLTVAQNITFGLNKLTKTEQKKRLAELLTLLKLELLAERYPHQLSGGQQQRVAIARALATRPQLLLLDEPFSNIDARLRNELMIELRQLLKSQGVTAIFVTHNKDEVFTFADKVAVMSAGKIAQFGSPSDVCQKPNSWQVADFLQLGSWLPVKHKDNQVYSALGQLDFIDISSIKASVMQLLVKPQYIAVSNHQAANVVVEHVSVTEQGYHYLVASIKYPKGEELAVKQLSFYSDTLYSINQTLALSLKPHAALLFN